MLIEYLLSNLVDKQYKVALKEDANYPATQILQTFEKKAFFYNICYADTLENPE